MCSMKQIITLKKLCNMKEQKHNETIVSVGNGKLFLRSQAAAYITSARISFRQNRPQQQTLVSYLK